LSRFLDFIGISAANAQNKAGWGNVAEAPEDKGFSWTEPLFGGTWMAWTAATMALFVFIFGCMAIIIGMPLWAPLALSIGWGVFCFWKV